MKNKLYTVLFLAAALILCACRKESSVMETADVETTLPVVTETVPVTTQATAEPHSDLYLSTCSVQQIQDYFEEVVLDVEYSDGTGNVKLVQKWCAPIAYRIFGTPTGEDLTVLETLFAQLNSIPGFPGIYAAAEEETEALRISFLEPDLFRDSYSSVIQGEEATGATQFWYYIATNEIHSARIGYRTDIDQSVRNSVLIEEIVNTLGISDTTLREDSITYQYSDFNTALSDVDWILLNLLYHPEMQCGMDAEASGAVIQRLYY